MRGTKMADIMDDRTIYRRSGKQAQHEGARILVAEDSPLHRALIKIQLTMAGYLVEEVYNGIEAVSRIENSAPGYFAAVIMDVYMPVIDGIEATKRIRALSDPVRASVPITALSSDSAESEKELALLSGMDDYLVKPPDQDVLVDAIEMLIRRREEEQG